jgi:hypothetical protein
VSSDYEKSIGKFAESTDTDPKILQSVYNERKELLTERRLTLDSNAGLGAVGLIGTALSGAVVVSDVLEAAFTRSMEHLPTASVGTLLVSAFALAASLKGLKSVITGVKNDVEKYASAKPATPAPR